MTKDSSTSPLARRSTPLWPLILSLAGVIGLYLYYWYFIDWLYPPLAGDSAGIFGDKFGGFSALFSALAFAGVLYTIMLQRHELRDQRIQFLETRLAETFYHLVTTHLTLLSAFRDVGPKGQELPGPEVFAQFEDGLLRCLGKREEDQDERAYVVDFGRALGRTDFIANPHVWAYTQNFVLLLDLIHSSAIEDKQFYATTLRSLLSQGELTWLYCYSRIELASDEFRDRLRQYDLLKSWLPSPGHNELREEADGALLKMAWYPPYA